MTMSTDIQRCSPARAARITEMVGCDLCTLSVVKGDDFWQLLNYRVPHIWSICQKIHASAEEKLLIKLQFHYVTFTSDLWTSQDIQAYLTVMAHFISEQWVLESYVLETGEMPEHHTSRIIGK